MDTNQLYLSGAEDAFYTIYGEAFDGGDACSNVMKISANNATTLWESQLCVEVYGQIWPGADLISTCTVFQITKISSFYFIGGNFVVLPSYGSQRQDLIVHMDTSTSDIGRSGNEWAVYDGNSGEELFTSTLFLAENLSLSNVQ